jgi:hypothetical protein
MMGNSQYISCEQPLNFSKSICFQTRLILTAERLTRTCTVNPSSFHKNELCLGSFLKPLPYFDGCRTSSLFTLTGHFTVAKCL